MLQIAAVNKTADYLSACFFELKKCIKDRFRLIFLCAIDKNVLELEAVIAIPRVTQIVGIAEKRILLLLGYGDTVSAEAISESTDASEYEEAGVEDDISYE